MATNNLLEPSALVPLVIVGPGVPRGCLVGDLTSHVDLVLSLLEWDGANSGPELKG